MIAGHHAAFRTHFGHHAGHHAAFRNDCWTSDMHRIKLGTRWYELQCDPGVAPPAQAPPPAQDTCMRDHISTLGSMMMYGDGMNPKQSSLELCADT